jgi:hypothetical protein
MMTKMLKAGDIFAVAPPEGQGNFASNAIVGITTKYEVDGKARASHAGIVIDERGTTFEAIQPRYCMQNIWNAYSGCRLIIGRHIDMSPERFQIGWDAVRVLQGMSYPEWRLLLFARAVWAARRFHQVREVCSENVFHFLSAAGCRKNLCDDPIDFWWGVYPAYIEDAIRDWHTFEIIYDSF